MAVIRARQNIHVSLAGNFGLPVIINTSLPDDPDTVIVEFGTDHEFIDLPDYGSFNYSTSNGNFTGEISGWHWGDYNKIVEGLQQIRAIFDFLPVFKNRPVFKQPVKVKTFRASNTNILASDTDVQF